MGATGTALKREEEHESGWRRGWRYWKYAWTVIKNFIAFTLIYTAFEKISQSTFETIVVALLILIWLEVKGSFTIHIRTFVHETHVHRSLLLGLYKKFNDPEVPEAEEMLNDVVNEWRKGDGYFYINLFGSLGIYSYTLWQLLKVLILQ